MAYVRKTYDEWEIQGNYGYYWEMVTTETNRKDAKAQLKCYNENEPEYPHRIVKKRVRTKSYQYVLDNDTENIRCNRCGSVVLRQPETGADNENEYPYQCMVCDENLYKIETNAGEPHTKKELEELIERTLELLCLDD